MVRWIDTSVVIPRIIYASFVWWPKTGQRKTQQVLSRIQRKTLLAVTGGKRSAPNAALNSMLNLPPLHDHVFKEAPWLPIEFSRR